jgi:hypothetical protein
VTSDFCAGKADDVQFGAQHTVFVLGTQDPGKIHGGVIADDLGANRPAGRVFFSTNTANQPDQLQAQ